MDGREVPAWRYLYWLTWGCDQLSEAYDEAGLTLDWSETVEGTDLASYVRQQALDNTVLYATVENWAEQYQVEITEADQPEPVSYTHLGPAPKRTRHPSKAGKDTFPPLRTLGNMCG